MTKLETLTQMSQRLIKILETTDKTVFTFSSILDVNEEAVDFTTASVAVESIAASFNWYIGEKRWIGKSYHNFPEFIVGFAKTPKDWDKQYRGVHK